MDDDEIPHFKSEKEELNYWKETALQLKDKVDDLEKELVEFQENSLQLEKELEKSLEHADRANWDLRSKCNRLTLELDKYREKYEQQSHQSSKEIAELQKKVSELMQNKEKLTIRIRELEQKNDDLERTERVLMESVGDIEAKLNSAIERNALLENEVFEKETLRTMVQRLKDEQRDMQQELNIQKRQTMPDNNKVSERVKNPNDINKMSTESQTTAASLKSKKDKFLKPAVSAHHSLSCLSNVSDGYYQRSNTFIKKKKQNYQENVNTVVENKIDYKVNRNLNGKENLLPKKNNLSFRKNNKKKLLNNNKKENIASEKSAVLKENLSKKKNLIYDHSDNLNDSCIKKSAFSFMRLKSKKKN